MRQIAREVGVQAGALYLYTSDKQSLLFDLMRSHMEELLDAVSQVDLEGPPSEALDRFTRFHISFHLDRAEAVFISYMELRNLTEENFAHIADQRRSYEALLEGILNRGQESGDFAVPDTRIATMALIAMLTGLTTWYRDGGRLDRAELERIYLAMVHQTVSGHIASQNPRLAAS